MIKPGLFLQWKCLDVPTILVKFLFLYKLFAYLFIYLLNIMFVCFLTLSWESSLCILVTTSLSNNATIALSLWFAFTFS